MDVSGRIPVLGWHGQAADLTPLHYQFPVLGTPVDNTFKATLDNTAQSIQTLAEVAGITWIQSGQTPHGIWISVETQNARFGTTGTSASGTVGHVLVKDTVPIHFSGAEFIGALKLTSAAAGSYPVVQITLER
jgi:hypothetical protein